jgi:hypothetical protein
MMATYKKLSDYAEATTIAAADILAGIQGGLNVQFPVSVAHRQVAREVTGNATIGGEDVINVSVDASTAATITVPESLAVGTRKLIRRLGAYDTTNTNFVTIARSGSDVFTSASLETIRMYGNGGNWLIEKVTSTRWEIVAGWDGGNNDNGFWHRTSFGEHTASRTFDALETGFITVTWPLPFVSTSYRIGGCSSASTSNISIALKVANKLTSTISAAGALGGTGYANAKMDIIATGRLY